MSTIAIMATYPGRADTVAEAASSIATQVDQMYLVLNQYREEPSAGAFPKNVHFIFPEDDLKDTGKFYHRPNPDDFVFLCDDDIIYPDDYVEVLRQKWAEYSDYSPIIGVHGITYSDFFDGDPQARIVHVFSQALAEDCFVNQLGTGTIVCRGFQMPEFEFMKSSARFVDLRFALHCQNNGYNRICVARDKNWMKEMQTDTSLFETFTKTWDPQIVREAHLIAGFRFLPQLGAVLRP
jgi:hypothetical protein